MGRRDSFSQKAWDKIIRLNAYFEEYGDGDSLIGTLEAPEGHVWRATGCHTISIHYHSDREGAWEFVLSELDKGITLCDDPDCEYCNREDDDD